MNLRELGHRRIANARAALLAKRQNKTASHDPAPSTDSGKVLAVIRAARTGLPHWAIARATKLDKDAVRYACKYLKERQLIFTHRTEYLCPKTGTERVFSCWFPGKSPRVVSLVDTTRCRVSMGYGRTCDTRLEERMDAFGRITWACPACERRNRGICRTCPRPITRPAVDGPAPWYCPTCLAARRSERNVARTKTEEYKAWKREYERNRVAACKAEGKPYRNDRPMPKAA